MPQLKIPLVFSIREQIIDELRIDLLSGRFAEGERLNESELAKYFGVSRTPIREAVQQLRQEGLVEGRPKVAPKVARRPPSAVRKMVVSFRRDIETFAVRSFFSSLCQADLRQWNEILELMRSACKTRDHSAITRYDITFHRSIIKRASRFDLETIWNSLLAHFWQGKGYDGKNLMDIYREHVKIVEALRGCDVELAVKTLAEHIN
jgi:DNA-binding GntR family transcriptional regulator